MKIPKYLLGCFLLIFTLDAAAQADSQDPGFEDTTISDSKQQDNSQEPESASQKDSKNPLQFGAIQIGGLWYLSYQDGNSYSGTPGQNLSYNWFRIKRGYLNFRANLQPWLEIRITPDVHQDVTGDLKVRLKYIYAKFKHQGNSFISKPYVEFGVVHMPWLDFEEHVNRFRMQDTMFMEREHLFNSADIGFTLGSDLGRELPDEYRQSVNDHYAGRYGSWQFGVYNGGGYHASELNNNKVIEARGTLRPLPDKIPGLQFSIFGIHGKGNLPEPEPPAELPDYDVLAGMVSYEHKYVVLTAQWIGGEGNAGGGFLNPIGRARPYNGSSYFGELRFTEKRNISIIGRYDRFRTNSDDPGSDLEQRLIVGLAWQMFKNNYWLVDYDRLFHSEPGIPDEDRLQITLQVSF